MKNNSCILLRIFASVALPLTICIATSSCKKDKIDNDVTVISGNGDITAKVDEFRQILGSQLNTTPGAVGGRREINWDGVAADLLNKPLPANFFNTIGNNVPASRQRGLVYSAGINDFQVSHNGFLNTNSSTAAEFTSFSGNQIFANVGSNLWDIGFQVPGQPEPATIRGFGLVFSDVDVPNSAFLEFFHGDQSLGKFFAPVHNAGTNLSFLGVHFKNEKITHVRVGHDGILTTGGKDISAGGQKDFVAFDDFLFSEPVKQ